MMSLEKLRLCTFLQSAGTMNALKAAEIAAHFEEKRLQKNELFLKEGQVSNAWLFLEEGFIRAYATDTEGAEVTTAFYTANQAVIEAASLFQRIPSMENLQALIPCKGWMISFTQLNHLFHTMPEFREFGRAVLARGFATLKMRMLLTITATAEQRYMALMKDSPEIFQFAPLKHIASYLGITDTSLSRIRKEMMHKQ
jgi:CRP-like cAMP-binding protein